MGTLVHRYTRMHARTAFRSSTRSLSIPIPSMVEMAWVFFAALLKPVLAQYLIFGTPQREPVKDQEAIKKHYIV